MKKQLFLFLLLITGSFIFESFTSDEPIPEEIELNKVVKDGGSRKPQQDNTSVVEAFFTYELLTVNVENYIGNIQVEIIGSGGFTTNFTVYGFATSTIDISILATENYTLRIITSTSIYTGEFIL